MKLVQMCTAGHKNGTSRLPEAAQDFQCSVLYGGSSGETTPLQGTSTEAGRVIDGQLTDIGHSFHSSIYFRGAARRAAHQVCYGIASELPDAN